MKFAILGLLVVLVIAFFVVVWKAAKEWRWYNIVAAIFTMLLAVVLIFPTAGVLSSRSAWHLKKEELEKRADDSRVEQKILKYGDPSVQGSEGIVQLTQELSKMGLEAGRRWRNLRPTNNTGASITLVKPQPQQDVVGLDPAADEAPAADAGPMIPDGLVVYGFSEFKNNPQGLLLPTVFLGEFRVTASTPTEVTLTPLPNATLPQQVAQAQSWSLYEMLPLDAHDPFIAEGSVPDDDHFFGRVDEDLVRGLLGQGATDQTIDNYLRDGARATDDDPPLSRWWKIEFVKSHSIDVDSPDPRGALLNKDFFDGNGRAIVSRLQRGEDVKFASGDQILVKEEYATELEDEGIAKKINRYYIRPMNDYRFVLRRIRLRLAELETKKQELDFDKQVLETAIDKTVKMLAENQAIKLKLEQDLAQVQVEQQSIEKYTTTVAAKVKSTRDEMNRLHRSNLELEQRLEKYHREIQESIDAI